MLFYILLINLFASNVDFDRRMFLPRALALSGNLDSRLTLNESIYFNPASSAFAKCQSVEAVYSFANDDVRNINPKVLNLSILDTGKTFMGGGVGYTHWDLGDGGSEWSLDAMINRLFLDNTLGAGFSVSYSNYKYDNLETNKNLNFNFGLLYLLGKKTLLGISGYNLLGDRNKINNTSFTGSIRNTMFDFFSLSFAFNYDTEKDISYTGTFEFLYKNGFTVLFSVKEDKFSDASTNGNTYWGAGIGYNAPKISLIFGTLNSFYSPNENKYALALRSFF